MRLLNTLQAHLETIRQVVGAETVTLYFYVPAESDTKPLLCQVGTPPIPEFQDIESAAAFCGQCTTSETGCSSADELLAIVHQCASDTYILDLSVTNLLQRLESAGSLPAIERRRVYTDLDGEATRLWLGLRWAPGQAPSLSANLSYPNLRSGPEIDGGELIRLLAVNAHLVWAFLRCAIWQQDSLSQLPGRMEFQSLLGRVFGQAVSQGKPLGLLLINPDEFSSVNQRLGRKPGDRVLAEVAERLSMALRQSDMAFRYGGAVFAALLPGADSNAALAVTDKLRRILTQAPYAKKSVRLSFSMGLVIYDPGQPGRAAADASEMLLWADNAINQAKLAGGGRTMTWDPQGDTSVVGSLDRLSGIFTADTEKDYRNMLLLWETVAFIASQPDGDVIAKEFVTRIGNLFKPFRAALLIRDDSPSRRLLAEFVANPGNSWVNSDHPDKQLPLSQAQRRLLDQIVESRHAERLRLQVQVEPGTRKPMTAYAIPMLATGSYLGCLYIELIDNETSLDSSDIVFLSALTNQVANALAHAYMAAQWKREKEQESSLLKKEVHGLRQALRQSKMVFQSAQMQAVMDMLLRIAPTDATVLVTGESGTGKEMLARSLHELSPRKDKPLVTVDCGAISPNLLESEMFGRSKGAYTGADSASSGRIAQAEGGTLFLDEVGELPLDVQAKLLRFVQEKEITPVGANQSRRVDVRIVAATNRNLAEEVTLGRFRQDLYYRLQVFVVDAVPLRARPDDILPLARYFLEKYCVQYQKGPLPLSVEAETALLTYPWPGNVRELQNQILQAVVMSSTESIGGQDLNLPRVDEGGAQWRPAVTASPINPAFHSTTNLQSRPPTNVPCLPGTGADALVLSGDPWERLRIELSSQVQQTLTQRTGSPDPLGSWVGEDLVLLADEAHHGVARQACSLLGMPETTFRRQIIKARNERDAGRLTRTPEWSRMGQVLSNLLSSLEGPQEQNVGERVRNILLEEVVNRLPEKNKAAAELMGVTLPTYRRWKASARRGHKDSDNVLNN